MDLRDAEEVRDMNYEIRGGEYVQSFLPYPSLEKCEIRRKHEIRSRKGVFNPFLPINRKFFNFSILNIEFRSVIH